MVHTNAASLIGGLPNFSLYMGISGNILDSGYNSDLDVPSILSEWASQCVDAYNINETSCAFAAKSIKATNPAADILDRIASITSTLATSARSFEDVPANILDLSFYIIGELGDPAGWPFLDDYLSALEQDLEDYIPPSPQPNEDYQPPSEYNENLTLSSYEALGTPPYGFNDYTFAGVQCVDASLENISTDDTFARYIQGQISQDTTDSYGALIAYQGAVDFAICLSWPNATLNNAESYRSAFPSSVKNKILMIAETLNSEWSYEGAFATYEFVGSQNAVWLIHDAIGDGVYYDPNDCTYNAIREYLLTGMTTYKSKLI